MLGVGIRLQASATSPPARVAHKGNTDMHTIEEIAALLHIQEKAHANGALPNVAASALARLRKINEEMGPNGFATDAEKAAAEEAAAQPSTEPVAKLPPPEHEPPSSGGDVSTEKEHTDG